MKDALILCKKPLTKDVDDINGSMFQGMQEILGQKGQVELDPTKTILSRLGVCPLFWEL